MEQISINENHQAEMSMLGWIIKHNDLVDSLQIEEQDFIYLDHQKIFNHLKATIQAGHSANQLSLTSFFQTLEVGAEYLKEILFNTLTILNAKETLQILRELRYKRDLEAVANEIRENALNPSKNSQEIKDIGIERLEAIEINNKTDKFSDLFTISKEYFAKDCPEIYKIGLENLDEITGGFEKGDLIILGGRPSMGKSALATSMALLMAKKDIAVLIFSLEMNDEQVSRRIIANIGSLNLTKLKYKNLTSQYEVEAFQKAINESKKLPIDIIDNINALTKIRSTIKKFIKKKKTKVVIIDYIQLIKVSGNKSLVEKVTEISSTLKSIALELKIVIIGLSQLSRAVESREDKRPQLSDLRESGSIEQDANMVIFTFRPEYYLERQKPEDQAKIKDWEREMERLKGVAFAIVAKNRDGRCGEAKLHFDGEFGRFTEINNNNNRGF